MSSTFSPSLGSITSELWRDTEVEEIAKSLEFSLSILHLWIDVMSQEEESWYWDEMFELIGLYREYEDQNTA